MAPRPEETLSDCREAAAKRILYTLHAVDQMNAADRMIAPSEVEETISEGRVIEDYPDDPRGHSCLICGETAGGRTLHVVCSPKPTHLAIITAYVPDPSEWTDDFTRRLS